WLDHAFDRTGVVSHEIFELDFPSLPNRQIQINPETPPDASPTREGEKAERGVYRWTRKQTPGAESGKETAKSAPDISLTTFSSWNQLATRLAALLIPSEQASRRLDERAMSIIYGQASADHELADFYDFG